VEATYGTLRHSLGLDELPATMIVMRALSWPDAFPVSPDVWRKALSSIPGDDATISSERWRPWRAYAATHLVHAAAQVADHSQSGTSAQGVLLSRGD
jgi:AraC family transcriptional regulator of adaptative response / DNA-3-methyladenine glycosylase II